MRTTSALHLAGRKWSRSVQHTRCSNKSLKRKYFNLPNEGRKVCQKEILVVHRRHLARYAEALLKFFISTCRRVDGLSKTITLKVSRGVGGKKRVQAVSQIRFRCFTGCGIRIPLGSPYIWYSLTPSLLTTATGTQRGYSSCVTHQLNSTYPEADYPDRFGLSVKHFPTPFPTPKQQLHSPCQTKILHQEPAPHTWPPGINCVYVFSLIPLNVMTWRRPSTAETCSHHLTNKYDPTTVVFWRTNPPSFV
jgi:hypothetical protein